MLHFAQHSERDLRRQVHEYEIRRAVRNLVENAVAYGRKASVGLTQCDNVYEILVEDEGPGIPEADQGRVFEPFVRLESSRKL